MPARPLGHPSAIRAGRKKHERSNPNRERRETGPAKPQGSQEREGEPTAQGAVELAPPGHQRRPLGGDAAGGAGG